MLPALFFVRLVDNLSLLEWLAGVALVEGDFCCVAGGVEGVGVVWEGLDVFPVSLLGLFRLYCQQSFGQCRLSALRRSVSCIDPFSFSFSPKLRNVCLLMNWRVDKFVYL